MSRSDVRAAGTCLFMLKPSACRETKLFCLTKRSPIKNILIFISISHVSIRLEYLFNQFYTCRLERGKGMVDQLHQNKHLRTSLDSVFQTEQCLKIPCGEKGKFTIIVCQNSHVSKITFYMQTQHLTKGRELFQVRFDLQHTAVQRVQTKFQNTLTKYVFWDRKI